MKRTILFPLLFVQTFLIGQDQFCDYTITPNLFYSPNTTTVAQIAIGPHYLCGPNTIVYDTVQMGCHKVYVNSGCTLIFDYGDCPSIGQIWLKNNSTLILKSNAGVQVYSEPLAVINNTAGAAIQIYTCSSISFPTVNCANGFTENNLNDKFNIWPCPASFKINFNFNSSTDIFADITIKNSFGQIISSLSQFPLDNKELPIDNLNNGTFFINIQTKSWRQTKKIIILR